MLRNSVTNLLSIKRPFKVALMLVSDIFLVVLCVWISFYLRLGEFVSLTDTNDGFRPLLASCVSLLFVTPIFLWFRVYATVIRLTDWQSLEALFKAVLVYAIIYALIFTLFGVSGIPRAIGILQPLLLLLLTVFTRISFKIILNSSFSTFEKSSKPRVLIYGAGIYGREFLAAMRASNHSIILGFIDENEGLSGLQIGGVRVFDPLLIEEVIKKERIDRIILAMPNASRRWRAEITQKLSSYGVEILSIPSYSDLAEGKIAFSELRQLTMVDVLGRTAVQPDETLMECDIKNRHVLITGAGGSIGKEICLQICKYCPKQVTLLDLNEYALYSAERDIRLYLSKYSPQTKLDMVLGSVVDNNLVDDLFSRTKFDTVFHAAAYKHVSIVEDNVLVGIKNNAIGTLVLAQAAIRYSTKKFVFISTDKAVRPTSVMGASKRFAEIILQALAAGCSTTTFAIVRFGNVLASSGSVVPLFLKQIQSGGPVTVTHADVNRYFMTIEEAAQLVVQAGAMTTQGPTAPVFLLDMGEPIKIIDLARKMIELSGLREFDKNTGQGDIEIKIIGLRDGEKLDEELLIADAASCSAHPKIMLASEEFLKWDDLKHHIDRIQIGIEKSDMKLVLEHLSIVCKTILSKTDSRLKPQGKKK